MTWWWILAALAALYIAGRVAAWVRGAPRAEDIRYHFGSWVGALAARFSDKPDGNWKMTFGRHTYVRGSEILAESRAHEFAHSLDMHCRSIPVVLCDCVYQYVRYGYRYSPIEVAARRFAAAHQAEFPDVRRAT